VIQESTHPGNQEKSLHEFRGWMSALGRKLPKRRQCTSLSYAASKELNRDIGIAVRPGLQDFIQNHPRGKTAGF
jgi:hypothetical protein